jgi:hypothetical protein
MLDTLRNHSSQTISLWAHNEPIARNLKIGGRESLKLDKALDHLLEFNRWHKDRYGVPAWADIRNANNQPLLPSNFNDLATFSEKVNPETLKDFVVDKFYQNFPDSSKGQFILDEDMDKVLLSYNRGVAPYEQGIKNRAEARSPEQVAKDLEKVRDLINSGELELVRNDRGVVTASERHRTVEGTPEAYKAFINAWRRSPDGVNVGNQILTQLHKASGRDGDVAQEALDAWDLIKSSNMSFDARKPIRNEISKELQARLDASFAAWVKQEAIDWRDLGDWEEEKQGGVAEILRKLQPIMEDAFYDYRPWNTWGN